MPTILGVCYLGGLASCSFCGSHSCLLDPLDSFQCKPPEWYLASPCRAVVRSNCFHFNNPRGLDKNLTHCTTSNNPMMILFGVFQIVGSQIPDLDRVWWMSIVAAIMSFGYSLIGLGLSIAATAGAQTLLSPVTVQKIFVRSVLQGV